MSVVVNSAVSDSTGAVNMGILLGLCLFIVDIHQVILLEKFVNICWNFYVHMFCVCTYVYNI